MQSLEGRFILVTGGVGSVGGVPVERCLEDDPAVVRVLDLDEMGLFNLRAQVDDDRLRYLGGRPRSGPPESENVNFKRDSLFEILCAPIF